MTQVFISKSKLFRKIYIWVISLDLARKFISECAIKAQTYSTIQLIMAPNINSQPTQTNQMQLAHVQNTRKTKTAKLKKLSSYSIWQSTSKEVIKKSRK